MTRGPNPLYSPDALPERTMQFLKEFRRGHKWFKAKREFGEFDFK